MRRRRLALPQLPLRFPMEVMQAISELPLAPFLKTRPGGQSFV